MWLKLGVGVEVDDAILLNGLLHRLEGGECDGRVVVFVEVVQLGAKKKRIFENFYTKNPNSGFLNITRQVLGKFHFFC